MGSLSVRGVQLTDLHGATALIDAHEHEATG
jgi:hypothetical protein